MGSHLLDLKSVASGQPLPPELRQRQGQLVAQALRLRERLGDPVDGLAELLSTLPPEGDEFWLQIAADCPSPHPSPRGGEGVHSPRPLRERGWG